MTLRSDIITACVVALVSAVEVPAQEPRTEDAAREAALKWLRSRRLIHDTTRVVASSQELWDRFVTCEQPAQRIGCSIRGGGSVTMVTVRLAGADTATVYLAEHLLITHSCPLGRPLNPPIIGNTSSQSFQIVYSEGTWRDVRSIGGVQC